jgi:hypothetical protein
MDDAEAKARFQRAHKGAKDIIIIGRTVPNAHHTGAAEFIGRAA